MRSRLAFTARYWGDSAVVCRALQDHPGPAVVQEFGSFKTWTQANAFASLNQGLDLDSSEVRQIVTNSQLLASDLLRASFPPEPFSPLTFARANTSRLLGEATLAELNLALVFCRLLQTEPKLHSPRILRSARNALFNALHFLLRSDLDTTDLDKITASLGALYNALLEVSLPAEHAHYQATPGTPYGKVHHERPM